MRVRDRLSARQVPFYSRFIARVSRDYPRMLPDAIYLAALGHHFERITRQQIAIHGFLSFLRSELEMFGEAVSDRGSEVEEIRNRRQASFERARGRCESIPDAFRYRGDGLDHALESFRRAVDARVDEFARSAVT